MKNTAARGSVAWEDLYEQPALQDLTSLRRGTVIRLFVLCLVFFFSIPFLATFYPQVLRTPVAGALNLGLVWAILQYPIGGAIAWRYAVRMRQIDAALARLATN